MNEQPPISKQKTIKDVWPQIIIFLVVVFLIVFGASSLTRNLATNENKVKEIVNEAIQEKIVIHRPSCKGSYEEYLDLKSKDQSLRIVSNQKSYAVDGKLTGVVKPTVVISGKDDIACGYLYIKASVEQKLLDDHYDSIYINPQGFGGHILRNKGISLDSQKTYTEALILLNSISYLPNVPYDPDAQDYQIANWANLLNVNSDLDFDIALSTLNQNGLIEEVSIAYKCWDPETGEETNNCQLSTQ